MDKTIVIASSAIIACPVTEEAPSNLVPSLSMKTLGRREMKESTSAVHARQLCVVDGPWSPHECRDARRCDLDKRRALVDAP